MKHALTAALLFLLTTLSHSEEIPAGWNKTRWGMTLAEVAKAYPTAQRPPKPETYEFGGRKYACPLILPNVTIAGVQFTAHFLTDPSGTLAGVQLQQNFRTEAEGASAFTTIKGLLTQKYVAPTSEENLAKPGGLFSAGSKSALWQSPETRIDLRFLTIKAQGFCRVSVAYQKPASTENL